MGVKFSHRTVPESRLGWTWDEVTTSSIPRPFWYNNVVLPPLICHARHPHPPRFTERLQRPPSRPRRNTLPRQPHPILVIHCHPRHDQQRRRIQQHKLRHRPQPLRHLPARQQPPQRRRILQRRPPLDRRQRVRVESKLARVKHAFGDRSVGGEGPCPCVPRTADFVEAFGAADDEAVGDAAVPQALCKGKSEFAFGDAEEHTAGSCGVDERPKDVEEGAEGEGFTVGRDEGHGGVVMRGKDEGEGDAGDVCGRVALWGDEVTVERLQDICGARGRGRCATTVL